MTNAELKFLEMVPRELHEITKTLEGIKKELEEIKNKN